MKYGYARVSTDGQSLDAQVKQLRTAGAEKVFPYCSAYPRRLALGLPLHRGGGKRPLGKK